MTVVINYSQTCACARYSSHGYYSRVAFISLRALDYVATTGIWGWRVFEEIRYSLRMADRTKLVISTGSKLCHHNIHGLTGMPLTPGHLTVADEAWYCSKYIISVGDSVQPTVKSLYSLNSLYCPIRSGISLTRLNSPPLYWQMSATSSAVLNHMTLMSPEPSLTSIDFLALQERSLKQLKRVSK